MIFSELPYHLLLQSIYISCSCRPSSTKMSETSFYTVVLLILVVQVVYSSVIVDPRYNSRQLPESLDIVNENKRQLEIKRGQLDVGQVRYLEQRVRGDIQRDLTDASDLEQQLAKGLNTVQEKKRQLEIKRSQLDGSKALLFEQRMRDDIRRELRDVSELEQQLARSLQTIQEKKRQLEIKRR